MPTTARPDRRLAFLLKADDDGPHAISTRYLVLTASLVTLTDDGEVRNILDSDDAGLAGLTVSGQTNPGETPGRTYGWGTDYRDSYRVDLARARAMAATLARLERRLATLADRFGYAESFGAYLLRVAEVLGVREFAVWDREPSRGLLRSGQVRLFSGPIAADWLAGQVRKFHDDTTTTTSREETA